MNPFPSLMLALLLTAAPALAQDPVQAATTAAPAPGAPPAPAEPDPAEPDPAEPAPADPAADPAADPVQAIIRPAAGATLEEFLWQKRPVLVFADSPQDPNFVRQMELIARDADRLPAYDIVVITDTDPAARSEFRKRFRPRGFSLVLMDKDGVTSLRKPLPWEVREITNAMDKFPTVRQEMLERYPSGR